MRETPSVVVVGAASRDLTDDDGRGWRLGGGVSYSSLVLARLGLRVGALVVADPPAAASDEIAMLRDAGVDVVIVPDARGPIFLNIETPGGRIQRSPQVSDPVDPAALPPAWRSAGAWLLGPVAGEIREVWASVPPADALVALGWQGLLRVLRAGEPVRHRPPGPSTVVRRADLIGVGRDDLDPTLRATDLLALLHPGATLLFTDGVHGGIALDAGAGGRPMRQRRWRSLPVQRYVDPVGAGDTFLAGVVAAILDPDLVAGWTGADPELRLGAACASLVLEGPGMFGVPDRSAAIRRMFGGSAAG